MPGGSPIEERRPSNAQAVRLGAGDRRYALEKRVMARETRPELRHMGVWKSGTQYNECNLTTFRGGLWLAKRANDTRPGAGLNWQLVVKSGEAK
jgi:hypothetical protein